MHRLIVVALSLLLTVPAAALVVDGPKEKRYERPPKKDPGWAHVGQRGSTSAVYLGNGWVLGVKHAGPGEFVLDGVTYPAVPDSTVELVKPGDEGTKADLILFRVDPRAGSAGAAAEREAAALRHPLDPHRARPGPG